ncbi:MAG: hypothetical protein LBV09_08475 [Deferribacteraceae bacterium]|jgi:hypothetical protein|nr:hypothetical protein [Deferribacteraceae bacterium]
MSTEFAKSLARANKQIKRVREYQPTMLSALKGLSEFQMSTTDIRQETGKFMKGVFQLSKVANR